MTTTDTVEEKTAQTWESLPAGEYAIVELFGHTKLVGKVEEIERFGTKMLAIQALFGGAMLPTVYYGGSSIYGMTPCSAEIAWAKQPRYEHSLPASLRAIVPPTLLEAPKPAPLVLDEQAFLGDDDDQEDR